MPKHKKTRDEKIKTQEKRNFLSQNGTYSFIASNNSVVLTENKSIDFSLKKDLLKTAIISSLILFLQIILYTLFKTHILALPFVRY